MQDILFREDDSVRFAQKLALNGTIAPDIFTAISSEWKESPKWMMQLSPNFGEPVPSFVLQTLPYIVRVVTVRGHGTGTVMQYRCGERPLYASGHWWLFTNCHVVCEKDTTTLLPKGHVEFFFEQESIPVRVDLCMQADPLVLSPPIRNYVGASESAMDAAVIR